VATVVTLRLDQGRPARRRIDAPVRGIAIGTMISGGEFQYIVDPSKGGGGLTDFAKPHDFSL